MIEYTLRMGALFLVKNGQDPLRSLYLTTLLRSAFAGQFSP
jgi:hypothetical protein